MTSRIVSYDQSYYARPCRVLVCIASARWAGSEVQITGKSTRMRVLFFPLTKCSLRSRTASLSCSCVGTLPKNGKATNWHVIHFDGLASSEASLLLTEGTWVEPEGCITPDDLGLWDDVAECALASAVNTVRRCSTTPVVLQSAYASRQASSPVPFLVHGCPPDSSVCSSDSYVETIDGYPANQRQGAYRGCCP